MRKLSKFYPTYDWNNNMGYGTKKHINTLELEGITKHHRKTFKPCSNYI